MTFAIWILTIFIMLDVSAIRRDLKPNRELRCYQGCVETYRADPTDDAGMRLADCTDRCEGE